MIKSIILENFRNFKKGKFSFSPETTVIIGPNASGKTNILEAIFLLATGKSFKAKVEEEMIEYSSELARVKGDYLEVILTRGFIDIGKSVPERVARKKLIVNGLPKRLIDFAGNLKVVLFGPWDLDLVTQSPSLRRRFLDTVLSQSDREYRRASLSYEKGLRQRNRLLLRIREEGIPRGNLTFWDQLLIKNGDYISSARQNFIDFANSHYSLPTLPAGIHYSLDYDKSAISETRLEQYREEEVAAATTLVGPHRDDMIFKILENRGEPRKSRSLDRFGSRGGQRMGVLWLKLAELAFIEAQAGEKPTLLLDDILSELDHEHRKVVLSVVGKQQTIITTADEHFIENFGKIEIVKLN